ncbi:MAG: TRAP transporter small permease [Candidatus Zixiibacteriota bacterium]
MAWKTPLSDILPASEKKRNIMNDHPPGLLEKVITSTSNILMVISMGMLLVMMFLGAADVFGRYLLNKPIVGTLEIFEILLPGIVLFSLAYAQRKKAHISIDIFYSRFPHRFQTMVSFVFTLWALIFFVIVTWRGTLVALMHWDTGRKISNISIPLYLIDLFIPVGAFAICLVLIADLLHLVTQIKKRR